MDVYYFTGKIFFRRTPAVASRCSVKMHFSISQNSSESTYIRTHQKGPISEAFLVKLFERELHHRCFFVNFGKLLRIPILQNTWKPKSYLCENLYHMAFLGTANVAKICFPWCLLNKQKKCLSLSC